ncbi:hypothetical protein [Phytohabitans rumicis]|uniref:Uncharacterized protein n=1 Tax=Phytohabitans rumicis TaxID=1076125 RepID=A0A6V8LCV7_9ACTN|nr:hypothetical protein [Phytohabitans rumicis]GFJ92429.1 hypothetical protein Prum_060710 [Phytohabitans rumicis]
MSEDFIGYRRGREEPSWVDEPTGEWEALHPGQRYPGDTGQQAEDQSNGRRPAASGRAPATPSRGSAGVYPASARPAQQPAPKPIAQDGRGGVVQPPSGGGSIRWSPTPAPGRRPGAAQPGRTPATPAPPGTPATPPSRSGRARASARTGVPRRRPATTAGPPANGATSGRSPALSRAGMIAKSGAASAATPAQIGTASAATPARTGTASVRRDSAAAASVRTDRANGTVPA